MATYLYLKQTQTVYHTRLITSSSSITGCIILDKNRIQHIALSAKGVYVAFEESYYCLQNTMEWTFNEADDRL
jgi:hypothetical protein